MVSGHVLSKIREKVGFSYFWGQTIEKKSKNYDEIGQIFVPGALDDTKKMRKAGADMFAKDGPENPPKKQKK